MAQYRLYASRSFKYVMTGNNELRRIWKEAAVAYVKRF
jgi:hypothetical protein